MSELWENILLVTEAADEAEMPHRVTGAHRTAYNLAKATSQSETRHNVVTPSQSTSDTARTGAVLCVLAWPLMERGRGEAELRWNAITWTQ